MNDAQTLLRLTTWLSPAFPTGGFAWSGGLEAAQIETSEELYEWCHHSLCYGTLRTDAVLLVCAYVGEDVDGMAEALAPSPERLAETREQGTAFLRAAKPWLANSLAPAPLPVAIGKASRQVGLPLHDTLIVFLNAAVTQQVQAAQRLAQIGQASAMATLAALEPAIIEAADRAARATLGDLGSAAPTMDICAMRHATLPSRIFRS